MTPEVRMVELPARRISELQAELALLQARVAHGLITEADVTGRLEPTLTELVAISERYELNCRTWIKDHLSNIRRGSRAPGELLHAAMNSSTALQKALGDADIWKTTNAELAIEPIPVPANAFPRKEIQEGAVEDGIEAAKCFRASRYTAAGFHAMRLCERVAKSLVPRLKLPGKASSYRTIDNILTDIDRQLQRESDRRSGVTLKQGQKPWPPLSDDDLNWRTEIVATFRSLKNAWRNKICHYKVCDEHDARDIVQAARAIVRKWLGDPGPGANP